MLFEDVTNKLSIKIIIFSFSIIPASVFRMWVYHEGPSGGKRRQSAETRRSNPEH